jgi:hypothetical protein
MNDKLDEQQARGCFQFASLMIFGFGSLMMLSRTSSLLAKFFVGEKLFGFDGMEMYYGIGCALLIEGYLVVMKVKAWLLPPKNIVQWIGDGIVSFVPLFLSAFAQVADAWISTDYIKSLPQSTQTVVYALIPLLIAFPLFLDLVRMMLENAPANLFGGANLGGMSGQGFFGWIQSFRKHNTVSTHPVKPITNEQDVEQLHIPANGKEKETVNPTIGKRS